MPASTLPATGDHGTQIDAFDTTGGSPPTKRHNFRKEHPDAYNEWRSNRERAEEHAYYTLYDAYGNKTNDVAKPHWTHPEQEDAYLRQYIRQVQAGTYPTETVTIGGDPIPFPKDHLSYQRARCQVNETAIPLWNDGGGADPADDWADALDARDVKIVHLQAALAIANRQRRLAKVDLLLKAFSHDGDDPGFASLLLEWVCDREPGFQLYCLAKKGRKGACGRKTSCNLNPAERVVIGGEDDAAA